VLTKEVESLTGVLMPEVFAWLEGIVEVAVEVGRPFAACAYENTGGAGAPSPDGLDEVELIVESGPRLTVSMSFSEASRFSPTAPISELWIVIWNPSSSGRPERCVQPLRTARPLRVYHRLGP
jgi:hypothetical protein